MRIKGGIASHGQAIVDSQGRLLVDIAGGGGGNGGGGGALPFIEIHQVAAENLVCDGVNRTWVWSSVAFDTSTVPDWTMSFVTDYLTINTTGTYRIDLWCKWATTAATRMIAVVERDPLGVGAFAFMINSTIFADSEGSGTTGFGSFTVALNATDILRVHTRRLAGGAPCNTDGANGPIWRLTKLD